MTRDAALLAEIYANPDDDAPRLIYADLLLERGDPRGELITLQIERGPRAASQRERDLLKKHGKAWLGPLAPVLLWGQSYARTEFRRGFVARAHLVGSENRKRKGGVEALRARSCVGHRGGIRSLRRGRFGPLANRSATRVARARAR